MSLIKWNKKRKITHLWVKVQPVYLSRMFFHSIYTRYIWYITTVFTFISTASVDGTVFIEDNLFNPMVINRVFFTFRARIHLQDGCSWEGKKIFRKVMTEEWENWSLAHTHTVNFIRLFRWRLATCVSAHTDSLHAAAACLSNCLSTQLHVYSMCIPVNRWKEKLLLGIAGRKTYFPHDKTILILVIWPGNVFIHFIGTFHP